tara:strand:- start:287 stop:1642 length:1356 start_codon:yes stop_codon:yes gene_type:complete
MAQKKNASFIGSNFYDLEPDSISDKEDYGNIVGDLAYLQDVATGNAGNVTHSGDGKGCPLNYPLLSQGTIGFKYGPIAGTDSYVYACPCFFPPGTDQYTFVMQSTTNWLCSLEVYDFTDTEVTTGPVLQSSSTPVIFTFEWDNDLNVWTCDFTVDAGTTGTTLFLAIKMPGVAAGITTVYDDFYGFNIFTTNSQANTGAASLERKANTYPVASQASGGATIKKEFPFEEILFDADLPVSGVVTTRVNREQNALTEYLTGAPVGTNDTLTLADSGVSDPTTSAFYSHKAGGSNGRGIYLNLFTYGLGNLRLDWLNFVNTPNSCPIGRGDAGSGTNALMDTVGYVPQLNLDAGASAPTKACLVFVNTQQMSPPLAFTARVFSFNSSGTTAGTYQTTLSVGNEGLYSVWIDTPNLHNDIYNRLRVDVVYPVNYPVKIGDIPTFALVGATFFTRP